MIDLRTKGLPNAIVVGGNSFLLNTDFRVWIKFSEIARTEFTRKDIEFLFVDEIPKSDCRKQIFEFFINPNVTPKFENGSDVEIFNYILDGEYIYGSFVQAYGIDLVDIEHLHWHKFKALFNCLPDSSKMVYIMGTRAYEKNNKKYEDQLFENKIAWTLPITQTEEEKKESEKFNSLFK